uniref:Uncharacterized protein n=1 Tax=Lepeophtheirus salmonis TaxID=72036 RepID=A0A0K2UJU3_LEPSM
MLHPMQLPLLF